MSGYKYSNVFSPPNDPPETPINPYDSGWVQQGTSVLGDKKKSGVWACLQNVKKRYFSGCSFTLCLAIFLLSAVLIANISFTIVALVVSSKLGLGQGTLMSGKCHAVSLASCINQRSVDCRFAWQYYFYATPQLTNEKRD